jgi:ribonuclease-3
MPSHAKLAALEQALGYEFKKPELIIEALTHRSHHHEFGDSRHNERLEFLGDAILDLCVTEIVMELSPETSEGVLSKLRSQLVSETSLAQAALRIGLGPYMRLGRGEDMSGGRTRDSLLADTFEAVLAAVYLDGGLGNVQKLIQQCFDVEAIKADGDWQIKSQNLLIQDHKSRLQELCQSAGVGAPTYFGAQVNGPDHSRTFTMSLMLQGQEVTRAEGMTKKEATQKAARQTIEAYPTEEMLLHHLNTFGIKSRKSRILEKNDEKNDSDLALSINAEASANAYSEKAQRSLTENLTET